MVKPPNLRVVRPNHCRNCNYFAFERMEPVIVDSKCVSQELRFSCSKYNYVLPSLEDRNYICDNFEAWYRTSK